MEGEEEDVKEAMQQASPKPQPPHYRACTAAGSILEEACSARLSTAARCRGQSMRRRSPRRKKWAGAPEQLLVAASGSARLR